MQPDIKNTTEEKERETELTESTIGTETTSRVFHFVFTIIVFLIMFFFYLKVIWLE